MSTETTELNTEEEKVDYYSDLSSADLAKQINDDYSVILGSERANLPRALAIAPKLHVLRVRAWGQWKTKFSSYGLTISYETASVYLRIWENWKEIQSLAAKKGVDPTHLTIDEARELWVSRNAKTTTKTTNKNQSESSDRGKPTAEAMKAREAANAEAEAKALGKPTIDKRISWLPTTEPEVMFALLNQVYPQDKLRDLTERLAEHLGMTLTPLPATRPPITASAAPTGMERRV